MVAREEVTAHRAFAVSRLTPTMMAANVINSLAIILVLWLEDAMRVDAVIWSAVLVATAFSYCWRFWMKSAKPFPTRLGPRTFRRSIVQAAILGLLWAYPGLVILPGASGLVQAFIVTVAAGMIAGGAITLYPLPVAAFFFCGIIAIGSLLGLGLSGEPSLIAFALVATTFSLIVYRSILRHEKVFVSEFKMRRSLAEQNERINEMLDAARAEALDERMKGEERLLQAQKMEAIGQLTGGIAHDFNNLLTSIQGHAELIQLEGRVDSELLDPILQSSHRGAELVQRLLAFARRQTLKPSTISLAELVAETVGLLRRTLREDIDITLDIAPDLWPVTVDTNLLGNAILNLSTNARDAMPNGGTITISLKNVVEAIEEDAPIDSFVRISLSDTGEGMTPEVRKRALDPFYTTKEFGKGSGLGLSMVYGFAVQSGGGITIESEVGRGTTVNLFLPRSRETLDRERSDGSSRIRNGHGERVLLVEDNGMVNSTLERILVSLDYHVTTASSVEAAQAIMASGVRPDIVLSDVVLPGGVWGTEFARNLARSYPDIAVILMSGYPSSDEWFEQSSEREFVLLAKPLSRDDLSVAINDALEEKRRPQARGDWRSPIEGATWASGRSGR